MLPLRNAADCAPPARRRGEYDPPHDNRELIVSVGHLLLQAGVQDAASLLISVFALVFRYAPPPNLPRTRGRTEVCHFEQA